MYSWAPACSETHSVNSLRPTRGVGLACDQSEPFADVCRDTLMRNIKRLNQGSQTDILGDGSSHTGVYFKEKWLRVSSREIQQFKKPLQFLNVVI